MRRLLSPSFFSSSSVLTSKRPAIQCRWFSKGIDGRRGVFGMVGLYKPSDFAVLGQKAKDRGDELLEMIYDAPADRTLLALVDELSDELSSIIDVAEAVRTLHPIQEWGNAAHQCHSDVSQYMEEVNCNERAYESIKRLTEPAIFDTLTIEEKRVITQLLKDMKLKGVGLSPNDCQEVLELQSQIREHSMNFQRVALCPGPEMDDYFFVPPKYKADLVKCALVDTSGKIPNSSDLVQHLLTNAPNEVVRRGVYVSAYGLQAKKVVHNKHNIEQLLQARRRLANLVGFPTFAQLALNQNIVKSPARVNQLLTTVADRLQPRLKRELARLKDAKMRKQGPNTIDLDLHPWDIAYFTNMHYQDNLLLGFEAPRFLRIENVYNGLNIVMRRLFGCYFDVGTLLPSENWAPSSSLSKLTVRDEETKEVLGIIFFDIWHRTDKLPGAATFLLKAGCKGFKNGKPAETYRVPECVVSCNFNGQTELSLEELVTLYHEMGHALHVILARTEYQQLSGTRGPELDFAEIPSTLMEHFAMDYRVLSTYAKDKDGRVMPEEVVAETLQLNGEYAAHTCMTTVTWALFDQVIEGKPFGKSLPDVHADLLNKYIGFSDRRVHLYTQFMHLIHYGAGYHSYLLSKAYAAHIWHTRFAKDPLSREAGREWREKVLQYGGARDAKKMLVEYMNVDEPDMEYFIKEVQGSDYRATTANAK